MRCGLGYQWRWFEIKSKGTSINNIETVNDCAKQCAGCKAFEYQKTTKTCERHVQDIELESKKGNADKQKQGWLTCVKVEPLDCDSTCGCGWYSSTKNLNAASAKKVSDAVSRKVCQPDFE